VTFAVLVVVPGPLQEIPDTPVIDQVTVPVGATPEVGPEIVAMNVKEEPNKAVAELVVTDTLGVT
jgi:hypothetical protein